MNFHEFFEYKDGKLFWKVTRGAIKSGWEAGTDHGSGYKVVMLNGKSHRVHRIIFAMHHGYLPEEVDHINGNKSDNRVENLRAATTSQNGMNKGVSSANRSGVKGVSWNKNDRQWKARVCVSGVEKYIGGFKDKNSAEAAVISARNQLHGEFANHG